LFLRKGHDFPTLADRREEFPWVEIAFFLEKRSTELRGGSPVESNASSSPANMLQMSNVGHCCTAEKLQPLIVKTEETRSEADINRQGMRMNSIPVPCASSHIGIGSCPLPRL